ncbi:hypothetical protein THAOC_25695, partial [Thalassiosira oceanica]
MIGNAPPFAVVVDEWRDAKTVVPSCRFACQLSKDFVEVDIDFSEPTCAHGQDLSSIETAQHGLERAHHITPTVSDDLGRKLVVQFLGLENVCLADLLCTPIRSIAEFYIENGIDPCDPNSLDDFLAREHETYYSTGVAEVVRRDASSRTAASLWPLNESELDYSAETRGWDKIYGLPASPPMASYRREGVRLNFWLTTGT